MLEQLIRQWKISFTTTHLFEWLQSRTPTTPNADEDVEQKKLWFIAGGDA